MEPNQQSSDQSAAPLTPDLVTSPTVVAVPTETVPPKVTDLFSQGIKFIQLHPVFFLWYLAPFLLFTALSADAWTEILSPIALILVGFLSIALVIIGMVNTGALLHAIHQPTGSVSYKESFSWGRANFFKLIWTYIVVGVVTLIGYLLLILPGIIASFFLYFALYAFYHHGAVGFKAVRASFSFVRSKGWKIIKKILVLTVVVIAFAMITGAIVVTASLLLSQLPFVALIVEVLLQAMMTLIGVASVFAAARLYEAFGGPQQGS